MLKNDLRHIYKEKRSTLNVSFKNKADDLMLIGFQQLDISIPSYIMTYAAMQTAGEFDPAAITDYCRFRQPDQVLAFPVVVNKQDLQAIAVTKETDFKLSAYGIPEPINGTSIEPKNIGLVIVPLLCFDERGYRVGYGKGYYDRFLQQCNDDTLKVGFSYFDPIPEITDVHSMDVRLDYCVTPKKNYVFTDK